VCKKAERPSIPTRIANVPKAQHGKMTKIMAAPRYPLDLRAIENTMDHKTSESSGSNK
jgi:hypothetical protein